MAVVRALGYLLLLAGLVVLGRDVVAWRDTGHIDPVALGPLWLELSRHSYQAVSNALSSELLYIFQRIIALWAAPSFLVLGAALVLIARRPRRRHRRR